MPDVSTKLLRHHVVYMGLLVAAAGAFPYAAELTGKIPLQLFHYTEDKVWVGGLKTVEPSELKFVTALFCVVAIAMVAAIEGWLLKMALKWLFPIVLVLMILGAFASVTARQRHSVSERELVTVAQRVEAEEAAKPTGTSLSTAQMRQKTLMASDASGNVWSDYMMGIFYSMAFVMWTTALMLFTVKSYNASQGQATGQKAEKKETAKKKTQPVG